MICCVEGCSCKAVKTPLFGKRYCYDCREAYESIIDDMKHEQKMFEYFTFEERMGLNT